MGHDLQRALIAIKRSNKLDPKLTDTSQDFIGYLDDFGKFRYLEISNFADGNGMIHLDRAVWELRRFCETCNPIVAELKSGIPVPRVRLPRGYLETVMDDAMHPARKPLLWQNAFFGAKVRRYIKLKGWFTATNSPLSLHPEILEEIVKYVFLPRGVVHAYRSQPE